MFLTEWRGLFITKTSYTTDMQQSCEIYSYTMSHHHYHTIANAMVNDPSFTRIDELK